MTHEVYTFLLCLITFTLLTGVFTVLVAWLLKLKCQVIDAGIDDEKIKIEYQKSQAKKPSVIGKVIDSFVLVFCCTLLVVAFSFSGYVSAKEHKVANGIPTLNVVKSDSMSYVNKDNQYVKPGQVTNQLQMFDLIVVYKLPKEEDLKINDIVVYEVDGDLVIHRIVAIEEPNEKHKERHFLLHGDANKYPDYFPVTYSQMKGIYTGDKLPMVGSFILFLQSPAGYLCMLLMVFAIVSVPIAEKSVNKRIKARLVAMGLIGDKPEEDLVVNNADQTASVDTRLIIRKKDFRTFKHKLVDATDIIQERYKKLTTLLARIKGVRVIVGKKQITFKKGSTPIARFTFRGKTLCALLALNPADYQNTKYIFTDTSSVKSQQAYPMRIKLSSERQTRWTEELIYKIIEINGFELEQEPIAIDLTKVEEQVVETQDAVTEVAVADDKLRIIKKDFRTFRHKLVDATDIIQARYQKLLALISRIEGVRVIEGKKQRTFKKGNSGVARFSFRGKTLCVALNLNPTEYAETKYIFKDISLVKSQQAYPMRIKLSSERQVRWTEELINDLVVKKGFVLKEEPILRQDPVQEESKQENISAKEIFAKLKGQKTYRRSFGQRLRRSSKEVKNWYTQVTSCIKSVSGVREIDSDHFRTYRLGNKPIAKITMKGKTLNLYLALNPNDYINTKYIFDDASSTKKYANYPMRIKLTSNRKVKWALELLNTLFKGVVA